MTKKTILFIAVLMIAVIACKNQEKSEAKQTVLTIVDDNDPQVSISENGAVSTAHPLATEAGVAMLEKGGNAIDAAVAAALALSVVEPSMSGLGGRLQAIVMDANGKISGVDATTQAGIDYDPETAPKGQYGYATIGVPGVVKGLTKLLTDHGSLDLQTVMQPAIDLAENGFLVLEGEALRQSMAIDKIKEFTGTTKYFMNGDTTYVAGSRLVQKDLANTLKLIATGGEKVFYEGEIAQKIVADVQKHGGTLSMEALSEYQARDADLVEGSYRGFGLHGLYIPSYGAITIEMLQILEHFDLSDMPETTWAELVYQANQKAYEDRRNQEDLVAGKRLTSKEHAQKLADEIALFPKKEAAMLLNNPPSWNENGHTTHLSVTDSKGNVIALTQSLGPIMGSKVATDGLGFVYAATLGGYLGDMEPGQRAQSHISPFIITRKGKPYLVLGAAGGSRIPTAVVQVASRVLDHKMPLNKALAAARVHSGDTIMLVETHEGTWATAAIDQFKADGYLLEEIDQRGRFGRVHAVMMDTITGQWIGAADPDWEGTSESPEK
ncbi:gamma-glutamyltransferase family protein [Flagellimonas beolgyonensis]|uniref:gamma-glutamyltransferase family protein n=1 Tax=Flagellimonas beolgyonensis TaxID=864064 RepID=UPI000F8D9533|nr:gamma-glutamyltransferase [Allomuricauda beolgyonensis]